MCATIARLSQMTDEDYEAREQALEGARSAVEMAYDSVLGHARVNFREGKPHLRICTGFGSEIKATRRNLSELQDMLAAVFGDENVEVEPELEYGNGYRFYASITF